MKTVSKLLAAAVAAFTVAAAHAAPPASIANTSWTLRVDGGAYELLVIDTQRGPGAPGNGYCREVSGLFGGVDPVYGWYCPGDGRIHLLQANWSTGRVVRAFMGKVLEAPAGQAPRIRGTTAIDYAALGDLGEVSFTAVRQ